MSFQIEIRNRNFLSSKVQRRRNNRRLLQHALERLEERVVFDTYLVTSLADTGSGSLRTAIVLAHNHLGLDTIQFKSNLSGEIKLNSELTISDDVNIIGGSARKVSISGQDASRVFKIDAGKVKFENLIITKGFTSENAIGSDGGAGILNRGNLELVDSIVTGNRAVGIIETLSPFKRIGGKGGGIQNLGTISIKRSEITNNVANFYGGGLQNEGTVVIERSRVTNNNVPLGVGGGIRNGQNRQFFGHGLPSTGTVTIRDTTVADNRGGGDGAGIRSENGTTLTIERSVVSGNSNSVPGTGGIASGADIMTITDSEVTRNSSGVGGIYLFGNAASKVVISRTEVSGNVSTVGYFSGGLFSRNFGEVRIDHSVFESNKGFYGGISSGGEKLFRITDSTIKNNIGSFIGGISNSMTMEIVRSTISGNTGAYAGGIVSYHSMLIDSSTISGNKATPYNSYGAGGIDGGGITLVNSTISGNTLDASKLSTDVPGPFFGPRVAGGWLSNSFDYPSTVLNSTIAFNTVVNAPAKTVAQSAGGVLNDHFAGYANSADVKFRNTIIARNEVNGKQDDVSGAFNSEGHNLIGVLTSDATGFVPSDLRGTSTTPLDPRLGPLAFNGGTTRNHRLLGHSPARDAGDSTGATATDQRGFVRVFGSAIDIGSVESPSYPAWIDELLENFFHWFGSSSSRQLSSLPQALQNPASILGNATGDEKPPSSLVAPAIRDGTSQLFSKTAKRSSWADHRLTSFQEIDLARDMLFARLE